MGGSEAERSAALEEIAAAVRTCALCRLHRTRRTAVPGEGPSRPEIVLLGEAPGKDEDVSGRPFVGRAGRILDRALSAAGLPREAVFITNVVKCRPPGNRTPKAAELAACRPYLLAQIDALQPRVIVTLGATALRGLLGPGFELKRVRGKPLEFHGVPVVATYHPAAVLYHRDLEAALAGDLRGVARRRTSPGTRKRRGRTRKARRVRP